MADLSAEMKLEIRQIVDEQNAAFRQERRGQRMLAIGVFALILSLLSLGLYATLNEWARKATEKIQTHIVAKYVVNDETFKDDLQKIMSAASLSDKLDLSNPLVYVWDQKTLKPTGTPEVFDRIDKQMRWHDNEAISEQNGFCFLTGVRGDFNGGGERVRVYLRDSETPRRWWFEGNSHVAGVGATVTCYKLK